MAELTINTGDITAAIKKNLEGYAPDASLTQVGRSRWATASLVCRVCPTRR
ncbi:MAG: hypothetical protein R2789_11470 [Microthrixaceae bacterium]